MVRCSHFTPSNMDHTIQTRSDTEQWRRNGSVRISVKETQCKTRECLLRRFMECGIERYKIDEGCNCDDLKIS